MRLVTVSTYLNELMWQILATTACTCSLVDIHVCTCAELPW